MKRDKETREQNEKVRRKGSKIVWGRVHFQLVRIRQLIVDTFGISWDLGNLINKTEMSVFVCNEFTAKKLKFCIKAWENEEEVKADHWPLGWPIDPQINIWGIKLGCWNCAWRHNLAPRWIYVWKDPSTHPPTPKHINARHMVNMIHDLIETARKLTFCKEVCLYTHTHIDTMERGRICPWCAKTSPTVINWASYGYVWCEHKGFKS